MSERKSILITQSLYGAISFYKGANEEWKERATEGLTNTIGRVRTPFSDAAKRGVQFENTVYNLLRAQKSLKDIGGSPEFQQIVRACEGGSFQDKVKFFMEIDGELYCIYGKTDVLKPELIIDIKTTGKWNRWSEDKYYKSLQHHVYCYGLKIANFEYHIAVFNEGESKIAQYHILPYEAMEWVEEERLIREAICGIRDFFAEHPEWDELWRNVYTK